LLIRSGTSDATLGLVASVLCAISCGSSNAGGAGGATSHAQAGAAGLPASTAGASASGGLTGGAGASIAGGGRAGSPGSGGTMNSAGSTSTSGGGSGGSGGVAALGQSSGGAGGASRPPCSARPGLLFCDDFETSALGAVPGAPWSTGLNGDGTLAVDDSVPAHSGSHSLHVHGSGFQTLLVYHDPAVLPQASGKLYARAFVRLAVDMPPGHNTFLIADTFAASGTGNAVRVGEMNSMLMMTIAGDAHGYLSNQNYYNDHLPGVVFAGGAFACLELLLDTPNTEIDVWVNGKEVPDLHVKNLMLDKYDAVRFGFEKYAGPVADLWYDDIAIGSAPIGCD
jgi:hypothetical protein